MKTKRPPDGLTVPVNFIRAIDGDTIEVTGALTSFVWAVRLKDCWCHELHDSDESLSKLAVEAKREAEALCKIAGDELRVTVALDGDYIRSVREQGKSVNPLNYASFNRVPGVVWLDEKTTLNQKLVEMKLASSTKDGALGT